MHENILASGRHPLCLRYLPFSSERPGGLAECSSSSRPEWCLWEDVFSRKEESGFSWCERGCEFPQAQDLFLHAALALPLRGYCDDMSTLKTRMSSGAVTRSSLLHGINIPFLPPGPQARPQCAVQEDPGNEGHSREWHCGYRLW